MSALEVVVRNVMAERHSAEKIAEVVDCTTSPFHSHIRHTALSRADDTLEVGDAALLPSGSAVKRRQQWLDGGSLHAGGASRSQVVTTPSITSSIGCGQQHFSTCERCRPLREHRRVGNALSTMTVRHRHRLVVHDNHKTMRLQHVIV